MKGSEGKGGNGVDLFVLLVISSLIIYKELVCDPILITETYQSPMSLFVLYCSV